MKRQRVSGKELQKAIIIGSAIVGGIIPIAVGVLLAVFVHPAYAIFASVGMGVLVGGAASYGITKWG